MPNNQDAALKPCPFCGNKPAVSNVARDWYGCPNANCPASVVNTSAHTWQHRAPTPREQELEAQNKALWELVGLTETTLNYCKEEIEGWGLELYNTGQPWQGHRCDATKVAKHQITKVDETLAAIQKAKEK